MDNSVIAKSGWLLKKNASLIWERNWVELYRDGYLKYYENDESPNAEEIIFMPTECISIKTGSQVEGAGKAPLNHSPLCVFSITATGNKHWILCGESLDDMRAWQLALEQSRLIITRSHHSFPMTTVPVMDRFPLNYYTNLLNGSSPTSPFPYQLTQTQNQAAIRSAYLSSGITNYNTANNSQREFNELSYLNYLRSPFFNEFSNCNYNSLAFAQQQHHHHHQQQQQQQQQITNRPNLPIQFPLTSQLIPPPPIPFSIPNLTTVNTINNSTSANYRSPATLTSSTALVSSTSTISTTSTVDSNLQRTDSRDIVVGMLAGTPANSMTWTPYRWW